MAGERLSARFSLRSQLWFQWTRKCFETATSHMQNVSGKAFWTMKYTINILLFLLAGLLASFDNVDEKLKDGYYSSSHGHATIVYKIDGTNIEWYLDNVIKAWGKGKYQIIQTDSVVTISLTKLKTSKTGAYDGKDFNYSIKISWDSEENSFRLRDYRLVDNLDMINDLKKRVKSSCMIRVERPSR